MNKLTRRAIAVAAASMVAFPVFADDLVTNERAGSLTVIDPRGDLYSTETIGERLAGVAERRRSARYEALLRG